MKKKLDLSDLSVTSFEVSDKGGVVAMAAITRVATACLCTNQEGCYPSLYCSLEGAYRLTCEAGCMTNENGYC